jgi:acetylornithine deacetylase/succinyl-diaminopimelate desuccinylase-like protein
MPEEGVNAIEAASRAILRVRDLEIPGTHALLGRPTVSIDTIAGGSAVNVVAAECRFEIDLRYVPGTDWTVARDLVDATIQKAVDVHALEVLGHHPAFESRRGSPLAAAALEAVAGAGLPASALGLPYGTEACRYALAEKDIVVLGPGERRLTHTTDESIRVADLDAGARIYRALAEAYV